MHHSNKKPFFKAIAVVVLTAFIFTSVLPPQLGYAQIAPLLNLPLPGTMIMPSVGFVPTRLMGMTVHPENPLQFDFIVDSGNSGLDSEGIKAESEKLVKYFLAALTVPKDDLWVNLSPHEHDTMVTDYLGKTILGRDMLAQDYYLKQLTASLIHPDTELGEKFWRRVKKLTFERYGTTDIPMESFNKVWVLPEAAQVYEYQNTVYITYARLKVMTDNDYLATKEDSRLQTPDSSQASLETEILREIIIPEIEKEVNEGANFAPLRQIYYSLILAKWYKETIKDSLLSQIYIDKNKVQGVNVDDETIKEQIYEQYIEAYKKGVFSFIKEDYDALSQDLIPRKYFSGGLNFKGDTQIKRDYAMVNDDAVGDRYVVQMKVTPQGEGLNDEAMTGISEDEVRGRIYEKVTRILGYAPDELFDDIERAIPVVQGWLEAGDGILVVQDGLERTPVSRPTLEPDFFAENETVSLGKGKTAIILQRGAGMDGATTADKPASGAEDFQIELADILIEESDVPGPSDAIAVNGVDYLYDIAEDPINMIVQDVYDRILKALGDTADESGLKPVLEKLQLRNQDPSYWSGQDFSIVLRELLKNAWVHTGHSTIKIKIGVDRKQQFVISVRDYGNGLAGVDKEKIFEEGFSTKKVLRKDSGMGMYLSRKFVRQVIGEGADIIAYDNRQDLGDSLGGATFQVIIPLRVEQITDEAMLTGARVWWHLGNLASDNIEKRKKAIQALEQIDHPQAREVRGLVEQLGKRIPKGKHYKVEDKVAEFYPKADEYRKSGYDFKINFVQEEGHLDHTFIEPRYPYVPYSSDSGVGMRAVYEVAEEHEQAVEKARLEAEEGRWIIDVPERIEIIRGRKFEDIKRARKIIKSKLPDFKRDDVTDGRIETALSINDMGYEYNVEYQPTKYQYEGALRIVSESQDDWSLYPSEFASSPGHSVTTYFDNNGSSYAPWDPGYDDMFIGAVYIDGKWIENPIVQREIFRITRGKKLFDEAMHAQRLAERFWDNDTKQQVIDEVGRLESNKLMILYFRLADVGHSESIYAGSADELMKIVLDQLRAKGLDEGSIQSIVARAQAMDPAMLVRTPQGIEGQLKILFADEPGGKKKTVEAVKELAGLLDGIAGDVEVSVLEAVGMGKDPAALEAIIREEHPSIVMVRSDTVAFKDPVFLKMSQENGVRALIRMGVGYDNINDAEAAKLGISVIRTHGSAESVADLSLWFMAALRFMSADPVFKAVYTDKHQWSEIAATDPIEYYALVDEGKKWKFDPGADAKAAFAQSIREKVFGLDGAELDSLAQALDGKTIGILGFGAIAKRLIEKLQAVKRMTPGIDFQVLVYSRSLTLDDPRVEGLDVEPVSSREELFRRANIVSIHIPGNDELKLTEEELANENVHLIINTARENLTPAPLMEVFLQRGGIYMGDLDLSKPLYELSALYQDQVLVLNHIGASTTSAAEGVEVNTLPTIRHTVEELLEMPASSSYELDIVNQVRPRVVASEGFDEAMSSDREIDVPFMLDPHLRKYGNTDTIKKVLERRINVDEEALAQMLDNKTVLVTGAGNVGRALAERLSETGAGQIIVVDNNEPALNNLREYLSTRGKDTGRIKYVIADLRDIKRLERVFSLYSPQIVFHTAAYRLVPRVEENPSEGFKVNVLGTKNLLQTAEKFKVERFVHYSSGKAADFWQSSLYGLTKELAEFVVRAYASRESATRYSIARLTHVIEGSLVIELFKKQIAQGQPVTITHGRMRSKDEVPKVPSINSALLQNVNEAVALGFNAALAGEKAEVFALKNYGNGTAIEVIARELFHDAGKEVQINYIPLREGDIERAGPIPQYPMFKMKDADNEWNNARELNDGVVTTHSNVTVTDALFPVIDGLRQSIDEMTNAQIGERLKTIISNIEKGQFKDWDEVDPRRKIMTRRLNFPLDNLSQRIKGKKVMVMGAGGNIAGAVLDEIFPYEPAEIVLVDNNENTLKDARQRLMLQLKSKGLSTHVVTRLVNLMRFRQVDKLFRDHHPQVIIHTAAHKLQPIIQENPTEPSINNLLTTYNIVLAIRQTPSVEDLVHVSTDKTAEPVAIYDLSKKVGELIVQSFLSQHPIRTTIVRFGNVLERSPVIDLFYEQIERGLPITITTPEAIRYFMRRDEAANLILSALSVGGHGDVFVLDMGQDISILQLAKAIIREKGFEPKEGENYEFIGAREGEKFSEGLFSKEEEALGVDRVNDVMRHQLDYPILDKYHMNRLVIEAINLLQENNLDFEFIRGLLSHIIQTNQATFRTDKATTAEDLSVLGDEAMITAGILATIFSHDRESAIAEVNGLQSEVLIKLLGDLFRLQETERILASSDFRAQGADVTGERRQEAASASRSLEIIPQVIEIISARLRELGFSEGALKMVLERAEHPLPVKTRRSSKRTDRGMTATYGMSEWELIMVRNLDAKTIDSVSSDYLDALLARLRDERHELAEQAPVSDDEQRQLQQEYQKLNIQIEMVEEKIRALSDEAMSSKEKHRVAFDRDPRATAMAYSSPQRLSTINRLIHNKTLITVIAVGSGVAVAVAYYFSQSAAHSTDGIFNRLKKTNDRATKILLINELAAKKNDSKFIVRNSIAHAFLFRDVMDELETMLISQGANKEDLAWMYQRMIVGLSEHHDVGAIIEATLKISLLGYDGLGFLLEWRERFSKLVKNDIRDGYKLTHFGDLQKLDAAIEFFTLDRSRGKQDNAMASILFDANPRASAAEFTSPEKIELMDRAMSAEEILTVSIVGAGVAGWLAYLLRSRQTQDWQTLEGLLDHLEVDNIRNKIKAADRIGWMLQGSWQAHRSSTEGAKTIGGSEINFAVLNRVRSALWKQYNSTDNLKYKDALSEALVRIFGSVSSSMASGDDIAKDQATVSDVGGIDMNEIDVKRAGEGSPIKIEMQGFEQLLNMPIEGFAPVIINVIPLPSVLPLLGLAPREEEFELSAKLD